MIVQAVDNARDVVPRWRSFADSRDTRELAPLRVAPASSYEVDLSGLKREYEHTLNAYVIADYLSALVSYQAPIQLIESVAQKLLDTSESFPSLTSFARLALSLSHDNSASSALVESSILRHARLQLAALRRVMRDSPKQATYRVDAALAHATLGNHIAARREAQTALQLAPDNRFVVRSVARFLITQGDFDEAAWVLRNSANHLSDPWILAALMSAMNLAQMKQTEFRVARELTSVGNHSPMDLAELVSEMATIELGSGKTKIARNLFRSSLQDPNENVVAQAEWASKSGGFDISNETLLVERGYEARARAFAREGQWASSLEQGLAWQRDEPFALEPALSTSYVATLTLEDHETALRVAEVGLNLFPSDAMLRNNAAYAAANLGRTADAREHLRVAQASGDGEEKTTITATRGLIAFREGDSSAGRLLYQEAVNEFRRAGSGDMATIATALWSIEELRVHSSAASELRSIAVKEGVGSRLPEISLLLERLEREFSAPGAWTAN